MLMADVRIVDVDDEYQLVDVRGNVGQVDHNLLIVAVARAGRVRQVNCLAAHVYVVKEVFVHEGVVAARVSVVDAAVLVQIKGGDL